MQNSARHKIIEAAAELFRKKGYHGVGINELIRESDVAKATFYNHFESKEGLCLAWLTEMHERSVEQHESLLAADFKASKKLLDYFQDLKKWMKDFDYCGCPYSNTAISFVGGSEPISKIIIEHKLYVLSFFERLCQGIYGNETESRMKGQAYHLLYSGAVTESRVTRSVKPIDHAIRFVKQDIK